MNRYEIDDVARYAPVRGRRRLICGKVGGMQNIAEQ